MDSALVLGLGSGSGITEDLIRKRAEHNACEIYSLEELSLHQQDIERIEHIDKWCRELKILLLQSNLISKIEHVGRLKKLEYLNLALNNITMIENLEGCESLKKLDFTINFIEKLTSVESLKSNIFLEELFLTGNPCTDYEGYREYVVATLPCLKWLDGQEVNRSERIAACQLYETIRGNILSQEQNCSLKKERQCSVAGKEGSVEKERKTGFDGRWYTDINTSVSSSKEEKKSCLAATTASESNDGEAKHDLKEDSDFWTRPEAFTPQSRVETHKHLQKMRDKDVKVQNDEHPLYKAKLVRADGSRLNINEAKVDFHLLDDEDSGKLVLDIAVYRYMDTSLLDIDVNPTYCKVLIKGMVLQLVLPEEILPDSSSALRSQTTGHLVISMVKARGRTIKPKCQHRPMEKPATQTQGSQSPINRSRGYVERLEVDEQRHLQVDYKNIVTSKTPNLLPLGSRSTTTSRDPPPCSKDFTDNPEVPPLI
ncbi:PREDICTED: protein tilB homolog [Priapulus caudatus]|uniref:Protein tilB homolog n=1 Tax=Priapulus caudatus TaxID=37621 RepID=A0ABM1EDY6_PRICU|nr:PREDICTED: protein tilB homolog [Priapulus caudatus]